MSDDFEGASDGDLRAQKAAIEAEIGRRETEDQAVRNERLRRELAEVRDGTRPARREHITQLSGDETVELVDSGRLMHLGFGPRRSRR